MSTQTLRSKPPYKFVHGEALLQALLTSTACVKWLRLGFPPSEAVVLKPDQAVLIVRGAPHEGKMRKRRVIFIREVDNRRLNKRDDSYWAGRACIRWHDSQQPNSPNPKVKRQLLSDLWDRILRSNPARWRIP